MALSEKKAITDKKHLDKLDKMKNLIKKKEPRFELLRNRQDKVCRGTSFRL